MNILDYFDANEDGTLTRLSDGKIVKGHLYPNGYYMVEKTVNKQRVREYVHRIVASKFVPNPHNYSYVNHIDGDKANNCATNLEWCTPSHNMKHANTNGLRSVGKTIRKVAMLDPNNLEVLRVFDSVAEACVAMGVRRDSPLINYACRGKCSSNNVNTAYGFKWKYVD